MCKVILSYRPNCKQDIPVTDRVSDKLKSRDEDPTFFSTDPDPAQLEKYSGSDLKSK